ncbi:hypothetical protein EV421DRAFT_1825530 [Armillaria borealis]|uniref:Uncharacterized protein n=1 Tax=Armillaria borealis TaxID=47425 RepID=A0AA39J8S9_9AGAR|nr:hypothetical protein EV421DRAFT_1825530 [Armillaria borealis]
MYRHLVQSHSRTCLRAYVVHFCEFSHHKIALNAAGARDEVIMGKSNQKEIGNSSLGRMLTIMAVQVSFPKLVTDTTRPLLEFKVAPPLRLASSLRLQSRSQSMLPSRIERVDFGMNLNSVGSAHTTNSLLPTLHHHQSLWPLAQRPLTIRA